MGDVLKTVNSVKNVDSCREGTRNEELGKPVRDSNTALQIWAKEHVPYEIRSARSGKLVIQKHVTLSAFFSVVLLLQRVFMNNPHRPSPLTGSPCPGPVCEGCNRFLHSLRLGPLEQVPRSHYLVFHAQYVFVSAIVLLQFVRGPNDAAYNKAALKDI